MERLPPLLVVVGLLVAWYWFVEKKSGARSRTPLWGAFSTTSAAILFLVAGTVGYKLNHGVPFTIRDAWSGQVIWSEIWVGAGLALIAIYLWRAGLRSLRLSQHVR